MRRVLAVAVAAAPLSCGDDGGPTADTDTEGVADTTNSSTGPSTTDPTPGTSMSMSGDPTTDDGTDTEPTSGTTEGPGCEDDGDCPNPAMPFCDGAGACVDCDGMPDPGASCTELDANNPVCNEGECVQCTAAEADACDGQTPICNDAENTCRACVEHGECPESACHLDGGDVGACFGEGDVQMIANEAALTTALAGLSGSEQAVLRLAAGDYDVAIGIGSDVEVAVLGTGAVTLSGEGVFDSMTVGGNAIVYVADVAVALGPATGVSCTGTSVWLDDSEVRNNAQIGLDISGGCAAHLRRTVVAVNNAGGIDVAGGELHMANSVVGRNGDEFSSTVGGIALDGTTLDITYSTIAINEALMAARGSVLCAGGESGSIRNSIVAGSGNSVDGCGGALFTNNAVDDTGLGGSNDNVGAAMATWFAGVGTNDFSLTVTGQGALMDIAMWQDGDPLADFEGDPIPTDMASFPGYDQP